MDFVCVSMLSMLSPRCVRVPTAVITEARISTLFSNLFTTVTTDCFYHCLQVLSRINEFVGTFVEPGN